MSIKIKPILTVLLFSIFLASCQQEMTLTYLMQHPKVVKTEVAKCQAKLDKTESEAKHCDRVLYAAASLISLINEQQDDPQKFGQKILDQEIVLAQLGMELTSAKQQVAQLTAEKASAALLTSAEEKVAQSEKSYQEKHDEIQTLLAVAGLNSPE